MWLGLLSWAAASFSFFVGLGPPSRSSGFIAAGALAGIGLLLFLGVGGVGMFLARTHRVARLPIDPERQAAIRRSMKWLPISYVPLIAGVAWLVFAVNQWAGHRGVFLGVSGVMFGVVASAAIVFPFIRVLAPDRRIAGMSFGTYTLVTTILGIATAVVLAVLALALPQP